MKICVTFGGVQAEPWLKPLAYTNATCRRDLGATAAVSFLHNFEMTLIRLLAALINFVKGANILHLQ